MKKRLIALFLTSMLIVGVLSACSNNGGAGSQTSASYDWKEYMEMGDYKELPYYTEEIEVTDEEVDSQIETILLYATEMETVTEGVVEDGDTINIAFVGKIDGEEFEGGSSESFDLTVGTTSMIDGFVEGLIGKKIGETVTLNLTFPDEYPNNTEVEGKDVVFDVTINSKKVSVTPELTDEFAKDYYDVDTVDELKTKIKEDLQKDKENTLKTTIESSLWDVIMAKTVLKSNPPEEEEIAKNQVASIEEEYRATAEGYGLEWADFLTTLMGTDEAGFQEMMDEYSTNLIKSNMLTRAIAKEEGITLSEKAFKDRLAEILETNNLTEETFKSYYNMTIYEYAEQNGWRDSVLQEMVMEKILELGKEVSKDEFDKFISENVPQDTEENLDETLEVIEDEEAVEETEEETQEG